MWDTRLVRNRIINDRNRILGVPTLTYFIDSTCYSLTSPSTRVVGYRKGFDSGQERQVSSKVKMKPSDCET